MTLCLVVTGDGRASDFDFSRYWFERLDVMAKGGSPSEFRANVDEIQSELESDLLRYFGVGALGPDVLKKAKRLGIYDDNFEVSGKRAERYENLKCYSADLNALEFECRYVMRLSYLEISKYVLVSKGKLNAWGLVYNFRININFLLDQERALHSVRVEFDIWDI